MKTTKASIAKELSDKSGIPEYIAKKQVSQVIRVLAERIARRENVMISGLGTFEAAGGKISFAPSKKLKKMERGSFDAGEGTE